jgi:hypothetical protein
MPFVGAGGSAGSNGNAGANASGSAGTNAGGSAGTNAGGSPGTNAGGSAGINAGGSAGTSGGGSAGINAGGSAGAAGAAAEPSEPDAGAEPPEGEPPVEEPPVEEPPVEEPPAEDVVGFSDIYGILVARCGQCHSGTPANLPPFAVPDEAAASAGVQPGGLADRIYARTVVDRTMPPACRGGDFGDPGCVSEEEAALLQAWSDGGYQP